MEAAPWYKLSSPMTIICQWHARRVIPLYCPPPLGHFDDPTVISQLPHLHDQLNLWFQESSQTSNQRSIIEGLDCKLSQPHKSLSIRLTTTRMMLLRLPNRLLRLERLINKVRHRKQPKVPTSTSSWLLRRALEKSRQRCSMLGNAPHAIPSTKNPTFRPSHLF